MNATRERSLRAYHQAAERLFGLIRGERFGSRGPTGRRQRAEAKLERTRALLAELGNPQDRYPIVHVTGTSGKGSTSAAIAAILTAAGYRVGLRTSPYLQVSTEKLQIGPSLIDAPSFDRLTELVVALGEHLYPSSSPGRGLGYAEAWSAISFLWFAERDVDLAIVEVGAGGRFDTTNVVSPVVSVITSVGFDHVVTLGPTLADIAWHKAGIIKRGSAVVTGLLPDEAAAVVVVEAARVGAPVRRASHVLLPAHWKSGMTGTFQQLNAQIAVATIMALGDQGFRVPESAIQAGLGSARLPGRLERMPGLAHPAVWIDGAHNQDKIAALVDATLHLTPDGQRPVVVLGLLGTKDATAITRGLVPAAGAIVATRPTVLGKRSREAADVAGVLRAASFTGPITIDDNPESAVRLAERIAAERGTSVLVTGSMYLAGEVRRLWYPDDEVVLSRTPWPRTSGSVRSSVAGALGRLESHEPDGQSDYAADHHVLARINEEAVRLER